MPTLASLNDRFAVTDAVRFEAGRGNLPMAVLTSPFSTAHIYLHGAHVTHFQQHHQPPLLFLSSKSVFEIGKPIRGGVPVIFPWFGPRDGVDRSQMHGFVRTLEWGVESAVKLPDGSAEITLAMHSSGNVHAPWPHGFSLRFTCTAGPVLKMSLTVTNDITPLPFAFEEGLHTYFAVSDLSKISVHGLRGHEYRDRTVSPDPQFDNADATTFPKRVDRLYRDARGPVVIRDPGLDRQITIAKENSATTVVWNPYQLAPGEFSDLDPTDPKHFVCVESCNARENAYTLNPSESHTMTAIIGTRPLS
jgi:glucose-6-phosphate 1-epimerase